MRKLSNTAKLVLWSILVIVGCVSVLATVVYSDTDAEKILRTKVLEQYKDRLQELHVTGINSRSYRWTFRNEIKDNGVPEFFTVCQGDVEFEHKGLKLREKFEYQCMGGTGKVHLSAFPWSNVYSQDYYNLKIIGNDNGDIRISDLNSLKNDMINATEAVIKKVPKAIEELESI